mmetsp:Transcript_22096/g.58484  ORF Transcript_22096/g.58484 Transcript_22096/m.58484 type:complete len:350 (+) Transcript_22096:886-1935(+)
MLRTIWIAGFGAGVQEHTKTDGISADAVLPHGSEPLLRACEIANLHTRLDDGTVAHHVGFNTILQHPLQTLLGSIYVTCSSMRMDERRVADYTWRDAIVQHVEQTPLRFVSVACFHKSGNQRVVANSVGFHLASLDHLLEQIPGPDDVASLRTDMHGRAQSNHIWLNISIAHLLHQEFRFLSVSRVCVCANNRIVADHVRLHAVLDHQAQPIFSNLWIAGPRGRGDQAVVPKGIKLHLALAGLSQPAFRPRDIAVSSVGFHQGVETDTVGPNASNDHATEPRLGTVRVATLSKRVHDGAVRDDVWSRECVIQRRSRHHVPQPLFRTFRIPCSSACVDGGIVAMRALDAC